MNPTDTPPDNSGEASPTPEPTAAHDGVVQVNDAAAGDTGVARDDASTESRGSVATTEESCEPSVPDAGHVASSDAAAVQETVPLGAALVGGDEPADVVGARHSPSEPWLRGTSVRRLALINRRFAKSLLLQGVIAAVVIGLWLLGKLSWNHDPLVSQRYRPVDVNVHTNRAQDAALEFHHDLTAGMFGEARLLAAEEAEPLVDSAVAACQPPAPCASRERVFSRATLLSSSGQDARASVETYTRDGRLVSRGSYELSHASGRWLVTARLGQ